MSRGTLDPATAASCSAYGAFTLYGWSSQSHSATLGSSSCGPNPKMRRTLVWAPPISLAATLEITVVFFSSGYLDVSVRRVPLHCLSGMRPFSNGYMESFHVGSPIQTSAAPRISAPPRSFSQLITSFFGSQCQGILPALFLA